MTDRDRSQEQHPDGFTPVAEFVLGPDEGAVRTRKDGDKARVLMDEWNAGLFGRDNRITVVKRKTVPVKPTPGADASLAYHDIGLALSLHSHPNCRFRSTRLEVDLGETPGATVLSMVPLEVKGQPVELETKVGGTLKFEVFEKTLGVEASAELARKRTVYYPEIVGSGEDTEIALWDFLSLSGDYFHANRELRLLVGAPPGSLMARMELRAEVWRDGVLGRLPLVGRHKDKFTGVVDLA